MSKELKDFQSLTEEEKAARIAPLLMIQDEEKRTAWIIVLLQLIITLLFTGAIYVVTNTSQIAIAVLSGGSASVLNGVMLAWRMSPTATNPTRDAHHQLWIMYFYAIERYLVVVVLLGLSFVVLKFAPLFTLSGFLIGQFVLLVTRLFVGKSKLNSE